MMPDRLSVSKTYKLYINGQFPRSESGRSTKVSDDDGRAVAHFCRASRKDLRAAVEAARKAQSSWAARTAYNRGQILYRMGEMLEGKRNEFLSLLGEDAEREVDATIDRLIAFAGWSDKYAQVAGCHNPVAGPYYNFTVPEPTGVVGVVAPDECSLLALVSLLAPVIVAGNTAAVIASQAGPLAPCVFGEVCATSDVPAGVINILTGRRAELIEHLANHRDVDSIHGANMGDDEARTLRLGAAENVKRVTIRTLASEDWYDARDCESPYWIEPFVEMKTIWHPSGV